MANTSIQNDQNYDEEKVSKRMKYPQVVLPTDIFWMNQ